MFVVNVRNRVIEHGQQKCSWCMARRQADILRILKIHMSLLTQLEVTVYIEYPFKAGLLMEVQT